MGIDFLFMIFIKLWKIPMSKLKIKKYKKCHQCGKKKPLDKYKNCWECDNYGGTNA